VNFKQTLGTATAAVGLSVLAAIAFSNRGPVIGGKSAAESRPTLSFDHVGCTILVDDKPVPPDVIMPYPASSLVRSFDATASDGTTRHYSAGFGLDRQTFSVSIFDNDKSVPDPSGSFNVHPTLAHDSVPAQLPVINFQLRTPKNGVDPVIGVNCLSH
jgi:hypothetical protein